MDDMTDQLPYRAEYAKSNRSKCKSCKTEIAKDSLRLAAMVQSAKFDGKVPNWYHYMCFFGKQRPKNVGDIEHFDSLRWDDQEKIKTKIAEKAAGGAEPEPKAAKKATKRGKYVKSNSDFTVEYAKSSRALCRGCELKLAKGEVRISKKDFESEGARRYGGQDLWHHVDCFVKLRTDLEFYDSGETISGFNALNDDDKALVKNSLPKIDRPKIKDEVDGAPSEKKIKKEDSANGNDQKVPGEDALKKQNKRMFEYRDNLKALNRNQLGELLTYNGQEDPIGAEIKLDRLADIMTFGALKPCKVCENGQLVYRTGYGYQCTGDLTGWTKCTNTTEDPERKKFKVPENLAEKFGFLEKYKPKVQKRSLPAVNKPSKSVTDASTSGTKILDRFAPFRDISFFLLVKLKTKKEDLKKKIEMWGGTVSSRLTQDIAVVISTKEEVERMSSKMEDVKQLGIQVVPKEYVDACEKPGISAIDKISEMAISPWGTDPKVRVEQIIQKSEAQKKSIKSGSRFEKKSSSKVTLKLKGGLAVDPDSGLQEVAHLYSEGKEIYNSVLDLSDVQTNKNSYYKLQLLASDSNREFWIFRNWGRIGTTIGGTKLDKISDLQAAKREFKSIYEERTGNKWKNRDNFVKYPGLMYPIDVDYGESDNIHISLESNIKSNLAQPVQDLVKMLFDVDIMKKVMMEFELDLEKMPLGKLSKKQIQKAYGVLSELQQKDGDIKPHVVIDATNRFYTLIPHDFGTSAPPLLDNKEIIEAKLEMLESLLEMEVAYSMLKETKGEGDNEMHPLDVHYVKLNTEIEVLDGNSEEFKLIQTYVKNTHAQTHSNYSLDIIEIFKAKRQGEEKRFKQFKKMHNRKLLWHGSRITNFAGILSQGLRIAPPEAPVTGYMFGKGVYSADMVSKSANYCMTSPANPLGLLLLCEVALGDMYERTRADYIEKLPPGKHSTKGVGATSPDPSGSHVTSDGLEIPCGKGVQSVHRSATSLLYNEYVVYDVAQVKVQYLLKMKFNYL